MRKKKSSGHDEISQECLLIGAKSLAAPLTNLMFSGQGPTNF